MTQPAARMEVARGCEQATTNLRSSLPNHRLVPTGCHRGADLETGMYYGGGNVTTVNNQSLPLPFDFVTGSVKGREGTHPSSCGLEGHVASELGSLSAY